MVVKALYLLMNQDLKSFMLVFMRGQKKEKKYMEIDKENGKNRKLSSRKKKRKQGLNCTYGLYSPL